MTAGYILTAACDLRVMTTDSKARIAVQALNLRVPLEPIPLEMLRYVIPPRSIQYLMYTGREMNPSESLAMGLVDELAAPDKVLSRGVEMADHLMGVTMNEPGVSRLVSVDVEEAAEMAAV